MAGGGRRPVLDDGKQREILAMLTVGCSRRTAARYVGCAVSTIRNTAGRDSNFDLKLRDAERIAEMGYLRNIQQAAQKEQYWRAAAWALERRNPRDFAPRRPEAASLDQIRELLARFAELLLAELPERNQRRRVLRRLRRLEKQVMRKK